MKHCSTHVSIHDTNFDEFGDVMRVLYAMKGTVSDNAVNHVLNFAKAYRVVPLKSSGHSSGMIIN